MRDIPKIQCEEPTVNDHTIQDAIFNTREPTQDNILNGKVVIITPEGSSWNPYCKSYADNEDALTNAVGDLLPSHTS